MNENKITTGLNDRPKDASIGQSAGGLPDDSGRPIEVDEKDVDAARQKVAGNEGEAETEAHPS